jgi:hypothetical protein
VDKTFNHDVSKLSGDFDYIFMVFVSQSVLTFYLVMLDVEFNSALSGESFKGIIGKNWELGPEY